MGAALQTTDANFQKDVLDSKVPVLVDFWAEWCVPCRMMTPVLDEIAQEFNGKLKVAKVNVDENQQVAGSFHIRSIPTLLFFKDGKLVDRSVGVSPKDALRRQIDRLL